MINTITIIMADGLDHQTLNYCFYVDLTDGHLNSTRYLQINYYVEHINDALLSVFDQNANLKYHLQQAEH